MRSRLPLLSGAIGILALLVVIAVLVLRPRATGTVADALPREATAFLSLRANGPAAPSLLPRLVAPFPGLSAEALAGAQDITYLLLPGSSPAEPVLALYVRGPSVPELANAPSLTAVPWEKGTLVVAVEHRGRVTGFGRARWTADAAIRPLFQGLPKDADIQVGVRGSAVATLLQSFAPHALAEQPPLVLTARGAGTSWTVEGRFGTGGDGRGDQALLGKLPAASILAAARADLRRDLAVATAGGAPDALAAALRAVQGQGDAFAQLEALLAGPWAYAVLPSSTAGIRDAVVVAPLRDGDAGSILRSLEGALLAAGPYLTGTAVPEAVIEETDRNGVSIRYANFGSPARSVDYAVVENHLVLATSRDSMFAAVDALQGSVPALAVSGVPAAGAEGSPLLVRPSAAARDVPAAYRAFLGLADVFLLTRDAGGRLHGTATVAAAPPAPAEAASSPAEAGLRAGTP